MDNTTALFSGIQRVYRNAIVGHMRNKFELSFGEQGPARLKQLFGKKDPITGNAYWDDLRAAATERRSGGTGEIAAAIKDDYELLGVEHFFNVFEAHFDILCPAHSQRPKRERAQACQTLLAWMRQIKNVRDPVSHPITDDIDYGDSVNALHNAKKVLDFCGIHEAAAHIVRLQASLASSMLASGDQTLASLPPGDEVVMDFIGREHELQLLEKWAVDPHSARWALSGEGGKGKSAIAYKFARLIAANKGHGFDAVLWISAKRRRFVEGQSVLVDRPDFFDKESCFAAILEFFGEKAIGTLDENERQVLELLKDFPTLLVADDIDSIESESEDVVRFIVMAIPERTRSKVLITSRRAVFGMGNVTTQVGGLLPDDADSFIRSRCDLMGLSAGPVLAKRDRLLQVTEGSPLYLEDLLRLVQSGLGLDQSIGLWAEKKGAEARKYAMQREYEQLDLDAQQVLLALSLQGSCLPEVLQKGLGWSTDRLLSGLQQLQKMFLVPKQEVTASGEPTLALNQNVRQLVQDVFKNTEAYRRLERHMQAAAGVFRSGRSEDKEVAEAIRRVRLRARENGGVGVQEELEALNRRFPARIDVLTAMAWAQKVSGDYAAARMTFERAHDLGCRELDAYWHWSEMESGISEWQASLVVAKHGLERCGEDSGLLFRCGYALHRLGKELATEGDRESGEVSCRDAEVYLERSLAIHKSDRRNYTLRNQIHRALVLNSEAIRDGAKVNAHLERWRIESPDNPTMMTERSRIMGL